MAEGEILTWQSVVGQTKVQQDLQHLLTAGRLSHALLLVGMEGVGKKLMGQVLAKAVLTKDFTLRENSPAAMQFDGGNHPDFIFIEPDREKAHPIITIAQIRQMQNILGRAAFYGGYRVVLIDDAHCLNEAAMNALLKTLEEPISDVLFILVSSQPEKLLPTILSRCSRIIFNPLPTKDFMELLNKHYNIGEDKAKVIANMAGGSMARAKELLADEHNLRELAFNFAKDKLTPAKIMAYTEELANLGKVSGQLWGEFLLMYLRDLLCIQSGAKEQLLYHQDRLAYLQQHGYDMTIQEIFQKLNLTEQFLKDMATNGDLARGLYNFMLKWRKLK